MKGAPFAALFSIQKISRINFHDQPPCQPQHLPGPDEARIRSMATEIAGVLGVGVALLGQAEAYQV